MKLQRAVFRTINYRYEVSPAYPENTIQGEIKRVLDERQDLKYIKTIKNDEFHRMVVKSEITKEG